MQQFTGLEYLKIDIANAYGLDKELWEERLNWANVTDNIHGGLEDHINNAKEPLLYLKAVAALRKVEAGLPTGHVMFLDATASGLQCMATLSGCKETAVHVNLINNSKRNDVYSSTAKLMNDILPSSAQVNRDTVKKPLMVKFYGKSKFDEYFAPMQEEAFHNVMDTGFIGATAVMDLITEQWNPTVLSHSWRLPDGHNVIVKVTEMVNTRVEVDELNHTTFMYRFEANTPSDKCTSLTPNVIHSIDAYIAREMVRRSYKMGFPLIHIHDAFGAHPNNMNYVRQFYIDIMAEIANSDLLANILTDLAGYKHLVSKLSNDLSVDIHNSEYMLS